MTNANTYFELINIIDNIKSLELDDYSTKIINLHFEEERNDLEKYKVINLLINNIKINTYFKNLIDEYILGLSMEYLTLTVDNQLNIYKLIKYYNLSLNLFNQNKNKNSSKQNIQFNKYKLYNLIKELNDFITLMLQDISFKINDNSYVDLTSLSKVFLEKIKISLDFLFKYKLNQNNILDYSNVLVNMFYMIFYILIKNPKM